MDDPAAPEAALQEHGGAVWALAYRLLGDGMLVASLPDALRAALALRYGQDAMKPDETAG